MTKYEHLHSLYPYLIQNGRYITSYAEYGVFVTANRDISVEEIKGCLPYGIEQTYELTEVISESGKRGFILVVTDVPYWEK